MAGAAEGVSEQGRMAKPTSRPAAGADRPINPALERFSIAVDRKIGDVVRMTAAKERVSVSALVEVSLREFFGRGSIAIARSLRAANAGRRRRLSRQ